MKTMSIVLLAMLTGCHTEVKWAIRVPTESRECSRTCEGAPDDPSWQSCIAACGGEVSREWCDGTHFHPRDPKGCREAETKEISPGWTAVFVVGIVLAGGAALTFLGVTNKN